MQTVKHNQRDGDLNQMWHREKLVTGWVEMLNQSLKQQNAVNKLRTDGNNYLVWLVVNHNLLSRKGL